MSSGMYIGHYSPNYYKLNGYIVLSLNKDIKAQK